MCFVILFMILGVYESDDAYERYTEEDCIISVFARPLPFAPVGYASIGYLAS